MAFNYGKLWLLIAAVFIAQSTIVTCANIDYLNSTITNYFADTRHHEVNSAYKARAKEFIFSEFQRFGMAAEYQDFDSKTFSNVIGVLKGANFGKQNDRILGILAHYDTVKTTKGVDDNGAGVAAILEVARQLHKQNVRRQHTVIFVSPDYEEYGLKGSYHFVNDWLPAWAQMHYGDSMAMLNITQGCVVLDTMMEYNTSDHSQIVPPEIEPAFQGFFPTALKNMKLDDYEGDFLALVYRKKPDSALANSFKKSWEAEGRKEIEIESFPLPFDEINLVPKEVLGTFGNFFRSDHFNFWTANIPAIFITDTANFRGDMINCYHEMCDNVEVMLTEDNLRFLGKTADTLAKTISNMAGATETSGNRKNSSRELIDIVLAMIVLFLCM